MLAASALTLPHPEAIEQALRERERQLQQQVDSITALTHSEPSMWSSRIVPSTDETAATATAPQSNEPFGQHCRRFIASTERLQQLLSSATAKLRLCEQELSVGVEGAGESLVGEIARLHHSAFSDLMLSMQEWPKSHTLLCKLAERHGVSVSPLDVALLSQVAEHDVAALTGMARAAA